MNLKKVIITIDNQLFRECLQSVLEIAEGYEIVGEVRMDGGLIAEGFNSKQVAVKSCSYLCLLPVFQLLIENLSQSLTYYETWPVWRRY